ncbi:sulfatase [Candidatus Hydrogenedentota bacterium]
MNKPNIVIIMTDQHRADLCAREGYPLDLTPFLDRLAAQGTWFDHAYTSAPLCAPARVSMLTGRYPQATRVKVNMNVKDATYSQDIVDVLKDQGYATALSGKNHSHLTPERVDFWYELSHNGGWGDDRTGEEKDFDQFLINLHHVTPEEPTPFPMECQGPYRAVSRAKEWIKSLDDQPFFLWLSFAEPHNPCQVPEPYFSMFPPESLPPTESGPEDIQSKSFKWQWTKWLGTQGVEDYEKKVPRTRSNYMGMLRLIDDQVKRFIDFLDEEGIRDDTIIVFVADHGDFVGEYGLVRKGPEMSECLMKIPLSFTGPGIVVGESAHPAYVSSVDIMPTLCEAVDVPLPSGVQGRSLWPLLTGGEYPMGEFESIYGEQGFGGLHFVEGDVPDPVAEGCLSPGTDCSYDCLNSCTLSGAMRMVRKGDWKLTYDMQGRGELFNLADDPAELNNLYGKEEVGAIQAELLAELLTWTLRSDDMLPLPRERYTVKTDPRNYWTPHK